MEKEAANRKVFKMTKETIITISVTLLVAFSGYVAKYINDLRIAQRKDKLERVNQQLRDLYGPLFSLIKASTITWVMSDN